MSYKEETHSEGVLDIRVLIRKILRHWYYYVLCLLLFGIIGYAILSITQPVFSVDSTILIKKEGDTGSETGALLQELNLPKSTKNLENEIGILRSYNLIYETLSALDVEVSYFEEGLFSTEEKYLDFPFYVEVDSNSFQLRESPIYIKAISATECAVTLPEYDFKTTCQFGQPCTSKYFSFVVQNNFSEIPPDNYEYFVVINDLSKLTRTFRDKLNVAQYDPGSSLIYLAINTSVPKREVNFLNQLYRVYAATNLEEKNHMATQTIDFINRQLTEVSDSLRGAEDQLRNFRRTENVMDLGFVAASTSEKLAQLQSDYADLEVKLRYYSYLLDYLDKNTEVNSIVAPSSIGIADPLLNELIFELKKLQNEALNLDYSRGSSSYELILKKRQIENTEKTLIENVTNIINTTNIALSDLQTRITATEREANKLPEKEQNLVRIQRKFNLSDNLYNYLLQKRAEAGIAKASNLPDHKIIDEARMSNIKLVSPNRRVIYLLIIVLSFIIPTAIIFFKEFINDKISDLEQIERLTNLPMLGKIAYSKSHKLPSLTTPHSEVAEDFRGIRANLQYFLPGVTKKVVGITSTVSGEGKTFCAFNFASLIPLTGKSVVLIEADLRQPKFDRYLSKLKYDVGLCNYLIDQAGLADITQKTSVPNFDIITSGPIPPNPSELLDSSRFSNLITQLKKVYDYIVIDTPPTAVVSDYMVLQKNIDITLFVVRLQYSKQKFLENLQKDYRQNKYRNIGIIVNDVKQKLSRRHRVDYYTDPRKKRKDKKNVRVSTNK